MGFCFSFCRRQKSPERQPLLPKDREDTKQPRYDEILANIIASINAGKLPSQTQLDHAARIILNSEVLNVESDRTSERGTISSSWRNIVKDLREVIEASVEVGLQKNGKCVCSCKLFSLFTMNCFQRMTKYKRLSS
jgi:hypothetical protein